MIQSCRYPLCVETEETVRMQEHHVIPRSKGGESGLVLSLCPNHHNMIFIPDEVSGIHSTIIRGSIQIINLLRSTVGDVLQYIDCNDSVEYFYFYRSMQVVPVKETL